MNMIVASDKPKATLLMKEEKKKQKKMEGQKQHKKSKVVKVTSWESWKKCITHASNHGCPIMVHFSAYWCMPSKAISPFFEEMASTYQNILFLAVDVDEVKDVACKFGIKAMPTFIMMSGGSPVDRIVGANSSHITKMIHDFLHTPPLTKSYSKPRVSQLCEK